MKTIFKSFAYAAVAALALASCAKENLAPKDEVTGDKKMVAVQFGATSVIDTRASLTPNEGETAFAAAWEQDDQILVTYENDNISGTATAVAKWDGTAFKAGLPEYTGMWSYKAVYPVTSDDVVDFGANRTQTGSAYNSDYDIMLCGDEIMTENAPAGKTDVGKDIVFPMVRQTAIAYFHFTSDNDEDIVKATLSVEGGSIAAETAMLDPSGFVTETELSEIVTTVTGQKANDFTLWFNVLPTEYTSMTLKVETATKTYTVSKSSAGSYVAGKLYKVKKDNITWTENEKPEESIELIFDFKSTTLDTWPQTKNDVAEGNYIYTLNGVDYTFALDSKTYYGGTTARYLILQYPAKLGLPVIEGYRLSKVVGTLNDSGSPSTSSSVSITDGSNVISGGTAQTWSTKGASYTYDLPDTEANVMYYLSVATKNLQMITLTLTYEPASTTPRYNVTLTPVDGGALAASATRAEEGTEITLTATPDDGYEFNNDWTVTAEDNSVIEVSAEGKFTLPAQNVTVIGTFSKIEYAITANAAEHGSYKVKLGDVEVTKATIGDKITLEYTAEEGWLLNSWTVVKTGTEETVNVNNGVFYMPAAAVTITANVVEADKIPTYASLEELVADGAPTTEGTNVTVTLTKEKITKFYKSGNYTNGVYFMVGTQEIQIYCRNVPETWEVGGFVSGTLVECPWKLYNTTWELCPSDWSELTYTEPNKLKVDPTNKTWAADETDAQVFSVTANGEWTVTPAALDWASITEDHIANTITVTPNGENTTDAAYEAALTVAHSADPSLTQTITLKQNAAGQGGDAETWKLVTDASTLESGDVIVIVASTANFAMSTTQNDNNRGQEEIVKNEDGTVTVTDNVQRLTLGAGTTTGTFSLSTGDGYLYAASSSSNYLRTKTTLDANGSWTIAVISNNASIKANGSYTRNTIKYNSSNKLFSCYSSGQGAIQVYKLVN